MMTATVAQCSHTGWWYVCLTFRPGTAHEYRETAGGYLDRQSAEDYAAMIARESAS